jgi:hypothetical protein
MGGGFAIGIGGRQSIGTGGWFGMEYAFYNKRAFEFSISYLLIYENF